MRSALLGLPEPTGPYPRLSEDLWEALELAAFLPAAKFAPALQRIRGMFPALHSVLAAILKRLTGRLCFQGENFQTINLTDPIRCEFNDTDFI